ncbi:MAG: diacylglycerol kinase family protein [Gammaproteobacteria bacterium]
MPVVQLIINPHSGRGNGARMGPAVVRRLAELGVECEARLTNRPGHATELAQQYACKGTKTILIVGGDGSVFETVNGIMRAGKQTRLGIIPVGTGNDFAKMLSAANDWQKACQVIAEGKSRKVDIGRCNQYFFANGIGFGFDAQVALEANLISWLRGNAVYFAALTKILLMNYRLPKIRVEHDAGAIEQRVTLVAAANGRVYGGAFHITPLAEIDDGKLDIIIADGLGRIGILGLLPHVMRGTHLDKAAVTFLRSKSMRLVSDMPMPVHADGEIIETGATHLDIEILPSALNVLG